MKQRADISFEQMLNNVRKDEREFTIDLLDHMKIAFFNDQEFEKAVIIRDAIQLIRDNAGPAMRMRNDDEGVAIKAE
ncbi:MAG: hypothetical protein V3T23_04690 [Nitrososphaerales archaeon]